MASVTYRNVTKRWGDVEAVKNLSIEIPDGEFLVFVGPSGCGKSTSLRMLAGLEEITEGEIRSATASSTTWRLRTVTLRWCSRATLCTRT